MNFLNLSLITPNLILGKPKKNAEVIISEIKNSKADIVAFPELSLTGSTCGDLFFQNSFIKEAQNALEEIVKNCEKLAIVGTPYLEKNKLYNAAVIIHNKKIIATCKKKNSNSRWFEKGEKEIPKIIINGKTLAITIGEDIFLNDSPCTDIVININAMSEDISDIIATNSKRLSCCYAICNAGFYESTTDYVFNNPNEIYENGEFLGKISSVGFFNATKSYEEAVEISITQNSEFIRKIPQSPFTKNLDLGKTNKLLENASIAIKRRLSHIGSKKAVIGISGGLDSTMALLTLRNAIAPKNIIAISMPGFGTSEKTKTNAKKLIELIGAEYREIDITKSVQIHLDDIGHKGEIDITFENAQARERTQILMDVANLEGGIVIGTGDLSEAALGFCTYGGDHISMYNPNAGLPKTAIRYLVNHIAETEPQLTEILTNILNTKISPELIKNQDTEKIVGPYLINDFFLYYLLKYNLGKEDIAFLAKHTFPEHDTYKLIEDFYNRFYKSQYKRSNATDGPMLLGVSLSPRGGFVLPSDIY
ncbi:MAG: NAD(+) synthase [Defluviitaleaceae bacterium]|nr:NAD(+) synthase [Defluviitaleaceae bacterium]